MLLLHDGRRLTDDQKTLRDMGIKEDDVLLVEALDPAAAAAAAPPPLQQGPGERREQPGAGSVHGRVAVRHSVWDVMRRLVIRDVWLLVGERSGCCSGDNEERCRQLRHLRRIVAFSKYFCLFE